MSWTAPLAQVISSLRTLIRHDGALGARSGVHVEFRMWHTAGRPKNQVKRPSVEVTACSTISPPEQVQGEHVPRAVFVDRELRLLIVCTRARTCDPFSPEHPTSGKKDAADISHADSTPTERRSLTLSWTARGNGWTTKLAFNVSWSTICVAEVRGSGLVCMFLERLSVEYWN